MEEICFCARCLHFGYDAVVEDVFYYDAFGEYIKDYPGNEKERLCHKEGEGGILVYAECNEEVVELLKDVKNEFCGEVASAVALLLSVAGKFSINGVEGIISVYDVDAGRTAKKDGYELDKLTRDFLKEHFAKIVSEDRSRAKYIVEAVEMVKSKVQVDESFKKYLDEIERLMLAVLV